MNQDQIINEFVRDQDYRAICRKVGGNDADDLYQELVLLVLEIPEAKLTQLNETCLKCFFYRMAERQYNRPNSAFYRKYRKPNRLMKEHAENIALFEHSADGLDDLIAEVEQAMTELDGIYWYDAKMMRVYAEIGSMRAVAEETGIPLISIHGTVNKARKFLKSKTNQ